MIVKLDNNIVVEIIPEYAIPVEQWYGEDFAKTCVEAPENVEVGWIYNKEDHTFSSIDNVEQIRQIKISALSATCEQTIYNGLELELSAGIERFEYKDKDQKNIKAMFDAVVFGAEKFPYQAEDGNCRVFTKEDIMTLYPSLEGLRTSQLTYYNQLKKYVNTLKTTEEIDTVTYGQPLEGEYLQHYNEMIAVAEEQMQLVLSRVVQNNAI